MLQFYFVLIHCMVVNMFFLPFVKNSYDHHQKVTTTTTTTIIKKCGDSCANDNMSTISEASIDDQSVDDIQSIENYI